MANWDQVGKSIDRMGWPERIIWVAFLLGGTTVISFDNYIVEIEPAFKFMLAAVFLLITCAAFYYRLRWLELQEARAVRGLAPQPLSVLPAAASPLKFVNKSNEYRLFAGQIGDGPEVRAVIENAFDKTIDEVELRFTRLVMVRGPGHRGGQPSFTDMPRTLSSDRGREHESIAPRRERAFRLCKKSPVGAEKPYLILAPGSDGSDLAVWQLGQYMLHVIASARDVLPSEQTYLVEFMEAGISYRLCEPGEIDNPKPVPMLRAETWVTRKPEYLSWDKRSTFRLWEAAALWADEEPQEGSLNPPAKEKFAKLGEAVMSGKLPVARPDDKREVIVQRRDSIDKRREPKPNPQWVVTREDLEIFLQGIDEKPRALFPKERL